MLAYKFYAGFSYSCLDVVQWLIMRRWIWRLMPIYIMCGQCTVVYDTFYIRFFFSFWLKICKLETLYALYLVNA